MCHISFYRSDLLTSFDFDLNDGPEAGHILQQNHMAGGGGHIYLFNTNKKKKRKYHPKVQCAVTTCKMEMNEKGFLTVLISVLMFVGSSPPRTTMRAGM